MVVLLMLASAAVVGLLIVGVAGFELLGHLRRLRQAVAAAARELSPQLQQLKPAASAGRHRAGVPPG